MNSHDQEPALLTVQQAADALSVSASTVRQWIADGSLPTRHADGRSVRISADDVLKLRRSKIWLTPNAEAIWPAS